MREVEQLLEITVGLVSLGIVWISGIVYLLIKLRAFYSNLTDIMREVENILEDEPARSRKKEKQEFDCVRQYILSSYKINRKVRLVRILIGLVLLGITIAYFAFCMTCISLGRAYSQTAILPMPLLAAALFVYYIYLLENEKCGVHISNSASNLRVWLGVILPSISPGGKLRIVLGSMSPYPFSKQWFCKLITWLQTAKKISVKIVSGEPEFDKMDEELRKQWIKCWISGPGNSLKSNIRIVKERPNLQYVVTDNLVRIEKDHPSWTTRKKEVHSDLIPNHIHLFNSFLVRAFCAKFKKLWEHAIPVSETKSFSKMIESHN